MNCIFQILGKKDSGKTLVMEKVISSLRSKDIIVAAVKHTHHVINPSNKDTSRYMNSGSQITILHSNDCALFWKCTSPDYIDLIPADVILVEGFADRQLGKRYEIHDPSEADKIAEEIINDASECKMLFSLKINPEQKDKMVYMTLYNLMKKWGIKEVKILDD
ncbi:molybdopterin-guanine dinucleotide biosynthesis protein B [Metallosphaera hakonensis]|uniref:Molybdopterin-guanine dinucleotide biosynthesis protein B n=1 Tax=Metallosphaera hakonensis JCM 8857 = DSM 7519 TaxID=1293036 RepID=A0A2U9IUN8_9CREN|nr:molybdopterin-guanine dinucleotide biosynthesis protein B [Metallosphaera hakonensis]AWR99703.1 molybdopterin-guanine dinucleotide biosynthesis protein B [Metallosphaera hakonensis JCM 8857 = DSM 7519]